MIILIEIIILAVLFTLMIYIMSQNPIKTLYNYPPKIQERVKSLDEYKDKIPTNKDKFSVKVSVSIGIVITVSLIMKYINGYDTFLEGFKYSFLIWTVINLYDALIMDCLWFCHDKRFVFKGTEDMVKEYHDYWFHIKGSFLGEIIGGVVCLLIGLVVHIL